MIVSEPSRQTNACPILRYSLLPPVACITGFAFVWYPCRHIKKRLKGDTVLLCAIRLSSDICHRVLPRPRSSTLLYLWQQSTVVVTNNVFSWQEECRGGTKSTFFPSDSLGDMQEGWTPDLWVLQKHTNILLKQRKYTSLPKKPLKTSVSFKPAKRS